MERRQFIKSTAAIASVTAVSGIQIAKVDAQATDRRRCTNGIVLVDERFSDSRRFGDCFAAEGARIVSLSEDIGQLWYGSLRGHCEQSNAFIAGLTLHTDQFISQQFARECGKTLVEFGVHDCRGRRTMTHTIPADAEVDLSLCERWAREVACAIQASLARPLAGQRVDMENVTQPSRILRATDHPGSLYSWVIV